MPTRPRLSRQPPHRRLRLVHPEAHVHLTIHGRGGRQMLSGLLSPVGLSVELAQVKMAVGGKRAHVELVGQSQGLVVVAFGLLERRMIAPGGTTGTSRRTTARIRYRSGDLRGSPSDTADTARWDLPKSSLHLPELRNDKACLRDGHVVSAQFLGSVPVCRKNEDD